MGLLLGPLQGSFPHSQLSRNMFRAFKARISGVVVEVLGFSKNSYVGYTCAFIHIHTCRCIWRSQDYAPTDSGLKAFRVGLRLASAQLNRASKH